MVKVVLALAALTLAACTYDASFSDCTVRCSSPNDCPSGFVCGVEAVCRPVGEGASCSELGDAAVARCRGEAATCDSLTTSAACSAQAGCTFRPVTCSLAIACSSIGTAQQCNNTPGCFTDFTVSMCKEDPNYCVGATRAACEGAHDPGECVFDGGCTGEADRCGEIDSQAGCEAHGGCEWS